MIELGICGSGVNASLVPGSDSVYECALPESSRVSVQTGDIIGVDIESNNNMQFKVRYQQATSGKVQWGSFFQYQFE